MRTMTREEFMAAPRRALGDEPVAIVDDEGKVRLIVHHPRDERRVCPYCAGTGTVQEST